MRERAERPFHDVGLGAAGAADGAEDSIGGVAGAAFEIAAAEMTVCLHVADHRLDSGATSEPAFDTTEHPAPLA